MNKSPKRQIIDAALAMKPKDRESLAEQLMRSLRDVDPDDVVAGGKIAHRRIQSSLRESSRWVPEDEIERLISEPFDEDTRKQMELVSEKRLKELRAGRTSVRPVAEATEALRHPESRR